MDPISIASIIESSLSLALQCGSSAKRLNEIASQYKNAKLTILSMSQQLDTMQLAWNRIGEWSRTNQSMAHADDIDFRQRLGRCLAAGEEFLQALEADLSKYNTTKLTFRQRTRLIWNQGVFKAHQSRIQDQASSMALVLQTIQL